MTNGPFRIRRAVVEVVIATVALFALIVAVARDVVARTAGSNSMERVNSEDAISRASRSRSLAVAPAAPLPVIDKAAAKATLKAVVYADCGAGGPGMVVLTFAPSGSVVSAYVDKGSYSDDTKRCIAQRFRNATPIAPFDPPPVSFRWSINL